MLTTIKFIKKKTPVSDECYRGGKHLKKTIKENQRLAVNRTTTKAGSRLCRPSYRVEFAGLVDVEVAQIGEVLEHQRLVFVLVVGQGGKLLSDLPQLKHTMYRSGNWANPRSSSQFFFCI